MRVFILVLFLIPTIALSKNAEEKSVEKLMLNYLKAIKAKDREKLKSLITDKYFQELDKDNGIQKLFDMQPKKVKEEISVDIKVITQNKGFRANIKNKTDKEYSDYWYDIVKEKNDTKINGTFHLEQEEK